MNQIKAGAALNYVIIALNTIVGLLYTPYMLRCLGQSEYGLYSLVASIIAYLTLLDFGFGNAIIRYTAKLRAERKEREQWQMFGLFMIVYIIIGIIALCLGLALYYNIDLLFGHTMAENDLINAKIMMILLTFNLAITFPLSIFGSIITAYENFVFQKVVNLIRIVLCTFVLIFVLSLGYKAVALVVVQTIFNVLTLVLNLIYCKRKIGIKIIFGKFDLLFIKEIAIYSFWIFINAIMDRIYWGTGQFVLGAISGTISVAIFSVAILLQQMYMQFSTSIASVMLPRVTVIVTQKYNDQDVSNLFIRTGRIQCLMLSFILSGFIVFGQSFIKLWAGSDYTQSYLITLIFFISLFIPLIQNIGITILQARNQLRFRSVLYLIIATISLALQIMLAPKFGALGCAISIGASLIIGQGIIMNIYYKKKQSIDIVLFWKEIYKISKIPLLYTLLGLIIIQLISMSSLPILLIGILLYSAIYIVSIWFWCMNDYERNLLYTPIHRMVNKLKF